MSAPLRLLLLTLLALLTAAAPAAAAIPIAGAAYRQHDHETKNRNWHVDARVSSDSRALKMLVLYAEHCGGHTPYAEGIEIGPVGDVSASGPLKASDPDAGTYTFEARFVTDRRLEGTFQMTTGDGCETGPIAFAARTRTKAHEHADGEKHSHHSSGPPVGTMPDLDDATPRRLRQAERLWRATLRSAAARFPTIGAAVRRGFARQRRRFGQPVIFHLRSAAYERDRAWLDPRRPESLVYYWPGQGEPTLVAFMYRMPVDRTPRFARPLLAWHSHTHEGRQGKTQMSHVWLTNGLKSALSNCMPIKYLENHLDAFEYRNVPTKGAAHESAPCPAR